MLGITDYSSQFTIYKSFYFKKSLIYKHKYNIHIDNNTRNK